jgi:anti-sigma factor RsiW
VKCSTDDLQAFLDGEIGPDEIRAVRHHLGCCPACRQELSRLRLLWLELEQEDEIEIPAELPFLRQQAITRARNAMEKREGSPGVSLWEAQKLAWQPVLAGVAQIPGPRQLGRLARAAAGLGLPAVFRGVSSVAGLIAGRSRDRR